MIKLNGNDGSGHLAGGNLLWDLLGNIAMLNATLSIRDKSDQEVIRLDGKEALATILKGRIGGFDIVDNVLRNNTINSAIEIYNSGTRFMTIGGASGSMLGVRNDAGTAIGIGSYGNGAVGINVLGNAGAIAMKITGNTIFKLRNGEEIIIENIPIGNNDLSKFSVYSDAQGNLKIKL